MRLKARVHITPPHYLNDEADRRARELIQDFLSQTSLPDNLIHLTHGSSKYQRLRDLFLDWVSRLGTTEIIWSEIITATYSQSELLRSEILHLHVAGEAGLGGNAYGSVYEYHTCPSYGLITIQSQPHDLITDLRKVTADFASTLNFAETLVSERVRDLLKTEAPIGIELRPVNHAHPSRPVNRAYFQLSVHNIIAPLLRPQRTVFETCRICGRPVRVKDDTAVEQPDRWTEIHRWPPGPWNEFHFLRSSYRGWDLMWTQEAGGGPFSPGDPAPRFPYLLVSQRLYQLVQERRMTGFWVEPAHLDDNTVH